MPLAVKTLAAARRWRKCRCCVVVVFEWSLNDPCTMYIVYICDFALFGLLIRQLHTYADKCKYVPNDR